MSWAIIPMNGPVSASPESRPPTPRISRTVASPSSRGTAGGIEPGAITFDLCREIVDDSLTVSEDEIRVAMRLIIGRHHTLIEGSAAVAVASFLQTADRWAGKEVVIVLCGANVELGILKKVL